MKKIVIKKEKLKKIIEKWIYCPFAELEGVESEDEITISDSEEEIDNFVSSCIKKVKIRFTPHPLFGDEVMDFQEEIKALEEIHVGLLHAEEDIKTKLKRLLSIRKCGCQSLVAIPSSRSIQSTKGQG